jgi:hypothetical protein
MTDLFSILDNSSDLEGHPATSIRYATNVVESNGQTWFRWQYSGTPDEYYDIMYFDQSPERQLRYYQTVTPDEVTTYPETISYGPASPGNWASSRTHWAQSKSSPYRRFRRSARVVSNLNNVEGTGTIQVVPTVGVPSAGTVSWETATRRAGDNIELVSKHTVVITSGPASGNPDYAEHWTFDALGVLRTMGPGWSLHRV